MCTAHRIAWLLMFIGAINWGLIGIIDFNLVSAILGNVPIAERIVYAIVGLAALCSLTAAKCSQCERAAMRANEPDLRMTQERAR